MDEDKVLERLPECGNCPFELILPEEFLRKSVLDKPRPENHPPGYLIAEVCRYDSFPVCDIKKAAHRAPLDKFMMLQLAVVRDYLNDSGIENGSREDFERAFIEWTQPRRDFTMLRRGESYAERFRTIYQLGLRGEGDNESQILTEAQIYETVVMNPFQYSRALRHHKTMLENHLERKKKKSTQEKD
ncbi:MAG: hypothetical protein ABIF88_02085 [archaeon]